MSPIPHRLLVLAALLATSWACGAASPSSDRDVSADTDFVEAADTEADTAVVFPSEDGWWGVLGTLGVEDGRVVPETSALRLSARNADDTCEVATNITATGVPLVPPSDAIAWFTLTVEPGLGENRCAWPGPTSIVLGFGDTDPQLAPGAARIGVSLETVYGLYLGGADTQLIGVAGTEAQLAGTEMPATEAPLPDGAYTLQTLYGAPL